MLGQILMLGQVASKLPPKAKNYSGTTKSTSRLLVTKVHVWGWEAQSQETTETTGLSVKELSHFVGWHHQLPEEALLKRTKREI